MRRSGINRALKKGRASTLVEALGEPEFTLEALDGLVRLEATDAAEAVVALFADPRPDVRAGAVRAARFLAGEAAVDGLIHGILHWRAPYQAAREQAFVALWALRDWTIPCRMVHEIATSRREPLLDARSRDALLAFVGADCVGASSGAVAQLLLSMVPSANGTSRRVETTLGWLGPEVENYLLAALDDPDCRESVARVIGSLGLPGAVPSLVACLDDARPSVRRAAVAALGRIRDPRTMDLVLGCTTDADQQVRAEAHLALNGYGMTPVVSAVTPNIASMVA